MAHLDLDTTALTRGGARARTAAAALASSPAVGETDASGALVAAGDPVLARALVELASAWATPRATLADDLDALARGLLGAADVFGQGEQVTASRLAELLTPAPGGDA